MALGELGLMPDEFWRMTSGELMAKVRGFSVLNDIESDNFRQLFGILWNVNRGKNSPKKPSDLWPLDIDIVDKMNIEDRLDWYKNIGKHGQTR